MQKNSYKLGGKLTFAAGVKIQLEMVKPDVRRWLQST